MANAIYPGTFDPVHNGHVDIVTRASKLFEKLCVAVYSGPSKNVIFSAKERVDLFAEAVAHLDNVQVVKFSGLAPVFAKQNGASFIVRGLRAGVDFESEFEMTLMWRSLNPEIDTVCMMSSLQYQFVYSSRIKEVAQLGGNVHDLVPKKVTEQLKTKLNSISSG